VNDRTCNRCNTPLVGRQTKFCSHACANRTTTKARADINHALHPWKTCDVESCDKPARARTAALCKMHYHRVYRYGSLERVYPSGTPAALRVINPRKMADLTGQRFGTLRVTGRAGTGWRCVCDCGEVRTARTGDLNRTGLGNTCGVKRNHLSEDVDYTAVHSRIRNYRGSADGYACVECGVTAKHWSYDHLDPDERISQAERTAGVASA
jgi:hypothetical protein